MRVELTGEISDVWVSDGELYHEALYNANSNFRDLLILEIIMHGQLSTAQTVYMVDANHYAIMIIIAT